VWRHNSKKRKGIKTIQTEDATIVGLE